MPPAKPEELPRPGELIAGKYRVERVLGQGGMGVVVAAEHVTLRQRVALKFLLPSATEHTPEARGRFLREAQAAAAIQSDHVARILDVGVLPNGSPYLVMEHLEGCELGAILLARGHLPPAEAIDYVLQACVALAEAHALGIAHRDLKPSNLFLVQRSSGPPVIKVLDFGLATAARIERGPDGGSGSGENLTQTGVVMGSLHYMPPEQLRALKYADHRADIWSLGVILYELLSGRRPFAGSTVTECLMMVGTDPPAPLEAPRLPPGLEAVILRCLEKDRERRPQSIVELVTLLAPFGGETSQHAVRRVSGMHTGSGAIAVQTPDLPSTKRAAPAPSRPRRAAVIVLASLALGGSATFAGLSLLLRGGATKIEADRLASFSPLPVPPAPENTAAANRIALGQKLFGDPRLSKNENVSCATCHPLDRHGADGKKLSRGSEDKEPPRNTLGIYNVSGFFALLWDGRQSTLAGQAEEVLLSPRAMATSKDALPGKLAAIPEYAKAFANAFPDSETPVTFENTTAALAAYEATLFSRGRWDKFLEGDPMALTDREKAGFNRFVDVGCVTCHFGPNVGATMFQKVGLVKAWPDSKDRGRYEVTKREVDWMVFRVPTLRNVSQTGPYFHDGSVSSLDVAIRMMALHQLGKTIDDEDVALIHAWLDALTGELPQASQR